MMSPEAQLSLFEAAEPSASSAGFAAMGGSRVDLAVGDALAGLLPLPSPAERSGDSRVLRHPLAEREIRLGDRVVGYRLIRARRRSIGFTVAADGLTVAVPKWIGVAEIESALREKSRWILRKLAEQQERGRRLAAARIEWRDGTTIPYLGDALVVVVDSRAAAASPDGAVLNVDDAVGLPGVPRTTLHVGLPESVTALELRHAVQVWLQRQALRVFDERCALYARKIGVRPSRLRLSSARTRWGSASADGTIRLNWRLIHFSLPTIDYVVAHELAHLREMNHSPRFWEVVRGAFPDFENVRATLKAGSVPMFD